MASLQRRLKQFRSLERLRDLQRTQAATQLAERNKAMTQAIEACLKAQTMYQQALEVVRRNRYSGASIDPLLYRHQLTATEEIGQALAERTTVRDEAATQQQEALSAFVVQHSRHKVASTAVADTREELLLRRQQIEELETQDQAGRQTYRNLSP